MTPVRAQMSAQRFCRASQNAHNGTVDCRRLTTEYSIMARNEILWLRRLSDYLRGGLQLLKRSFLDRAATSYWLWVQARTRQHEAVTHMSTKSSAQELEPGTKLQCERV
jgi:hypothetical protein